MRKLSIAVLLAASLFGESYNYEVTPVVGYDIAEGNINLKNYTTYGVEAQYNGVDSIIKPELSVLYAKPDYEDGYSGDTDLWRIALNGVYEYEKRGGVIPLAKFGAGYENLSDIYSGNANSLFGDVGIGAKVPLSQNIALKAEALYMLKFNDFRWDNNFAVLAGLNIAFGVIKNRVSDEVQPQVQVQEEGQPVQEEQIVEETSEVAVVPPPVLDDDHDGVPNDADKCPHSHPDAAVDTNGCELDSDGDGVIDYFDRCPNTPAGTKVDEKGCVLDSDNDGVIDAQDRCPDTPEGQSVNEDGCPKTVNLHITFENNSATIDAASMPNIEKVVEFMQRNKNYDIVIVGYTDSRGKASYNKKLSQKRADAVRNILIEKGVDASRISALGKGESDPIADNATVEGRAQNRRIEAELIRK